MLFLNFLIYFIIMIIAMIKAIVSAVGSDIHTPSSLKIRGNIISSGNRNSICLDNDRNMLILALPILWKKFVITIWHPTNGKASMFIFMALMAFSISSGSVVNRRAH